MAGLRVEVLVLVVRLLQLVSVQGWERVDRDELLNRYNTGGGTELARLLSEDTTSSFDDDIEQIPEEELPNVEDLANNNPDTFADHGAHEEDGDSGWTGWPRGAGGLEEEYVEDLESGESSQDSSSLDFVCNENGFHITLPTEQLSDVKVKGSPDLFILEAQDSCYYDVNPISNTLTVPFGGCNVQYSSENSSYTLQLSYTDTFGNTRVDTATCTEDSVVEPRANETPQTKAKCNNPTIPPSPAQNCAIPKAEQVPCGAKGISPQDCKNKGCCMGSSQTCYYPLDECTSDQNFVFIIRANAAALQVDPKDLAVPEHPNCKPVILNSRFAIFKFKVTECGAHTYEMGETRIFLAEVQTVVKVLKLKFGAISRSDPLRFMVECRYSKTGSGSSALASIGYMVKIPASIMPSAVVKTGLYAVVLRIAQDRSYSSFLPTYHPPLRVLLGKPVYLEVKLKSPVPQSVVLVRYCLAYPRSAKNALVLVYEGCANKHDPNVSILQVSDLPTNRYTRRFVVTAFQFMVLRNKQYLNEEIYFVCFSEICRPAEKTCEEQCFDGKAP